MLILMNCPSYTRFLTSSVPTFSRGQQTSAKYLINGKILTTEEVEKVSPESRTVAHWLVLLDWERQRSQPYVIVDPFDPNGLLYFSEVEYKIQARTLGSVNTPFIVVARPGTKRPASQNSPLSPDVRGGPFFEGMDTLTWRKMKSLRSFIARGVKWNRAGVVKVNYRNITGLVWMWTRELFHYLGVNSWARRQEQFVAFVKHFQRILRHNGSDFAIQRLKISLFALYSWLGGNPLKSTHELGQRVRLRNGLPVWVNRKSIRDSKSQNLRAVRLWASLLNIYKYIEGTHGEPPLGTITAPPYRGSMRGFTDFCHDDDGFAARLANELGYEPKFKYESAHGMSITTAGVNAKISMMSIPADAYAWQEVPYNNWVGRWFKHYKDEAMLQVMTESASKFDPHCRARGECEFCLCKPRLGRLHPIEEAAGKVRVVAICDYFTQVALKPVHDFLFSILRKLSTDATFDQEGAVKRFNANGYKEIYSYDLKAATDLIPIELYKILMERFLGMKPMMIWASILQDRDFFVDPERFNVPARDEAYPLGFLVRYTRGQPMGALSSWASLALLHHALVQYASFEAGYTGGWFSDYLVLGDDIVIADAKVAKSYLEICEHFGIQVGLAKSLVSKEGLMNFANQTVYQGHNVSPLSLKEEISAQNIPMRKILAKRILDRWGGDDTVLGRIKRILTQPQWNMVMNHYHSGEGALVLRMIRFLVENPFEREDCTTEAVIRWLGLLDPKLSRPSAKLLQDFDKLLRAVAIKNLNEELVKRSARYISIQRKAKELLGIYREEETKGLRTKFTNPGALPIVVFETPRDDYDYDSVGREVRNIFGIQSRVYQEYLYTCLNTRLESNLGSKLNELIRWIEPFRYRVRNVRKLPDSLPEDFPSTGKIVGVYMEVLGLPNPVLTNPKSKDELLFELFRKLPEDGLFPEKRRQPVLQWKKVQEVCTGPVKTVAEALAMVYGGNLPLDTILHKGGPSTFSRKLKRLSSELYAQWAKRDQSPCQLPADLAWSRRTLFIERLGSTPPDGV